METQTQISLLNVVKTYSKKTTVLDASFGFKKNRVTGLLGHNGAGKTTAIKIILGLLKANSGLINWETGPISEKHRFDIGYMPEVLRMPRNLTCEEVVIHQTKIYRKNTDLKKIHVAFAETHLLEHRHKLTSDLSKGLGRKLAWILATISEPKVLILDEPFSGLDPQGRMQMENWIADYKCRGSTVVLSTHDLHQAGKICDEVIVLKKGRVVFTHNYQTATHSGDHRYRIGIKGATARELQQAFGEESAKIELFSSGFAHEVICDGYASAAEIAEKILKKGWILSEMVQIKHRLENDVKKFFSLEEAAT